MFLKSQPALVLASTSAYRRALLARLGLRFDVAAPQIDETPGAGEAPLATAIRLARAKAQRIADARPDAWVIGSDQIAVLRRGGPDERTLDKPGSVERCTLHLQASSGQTVEYLTAVAVARQGEAAAREFVDTTRVQFRTLDRATIARYLERESPLDCAGGFKSEGLGIALCESIDSTDPSALIGLPLLRLAALLRSIGFEIP